MFQNKRINQGLWGFMLAVVILGCKQENIPEPIQANCQITQYTTTTAHNTKISHLMYNNQGVVTSIVDSIYFQDGPVLVHTYTLEYDNDKLVRMIFNNGIDAEQVSTYLWEGDLLTKRVNGDQTFQEYTYNVNRQLIQVNQVLATGFTFEKNYYTYNDQGNLIDIKNFQTNIIDSTERFVLQVSFEAFDNKQAMFNGLPFYLYDAINSLGLPSGFLKNNYTKGQIKIDQNQDGIFTQGEVIPINADLAYNAHNYVERFTNYDGITITFQYKCQ